MLGVDTTKLDVYFFVFCLPTQKLNALFSMALRINHKQAQRVRIVCQDAYLVHAGNCSDDFRSKVSVVFNSFREALL